MKDKNEELPPEQEREDTLEDVTDGKNFAARYQSAKQRDIEQLSQEIEDRSAQETKRKWRKWWIKTVLMLLLIAGSVAIMFGIIDLIAGESMLGFIDMVHGASWQYFLLLIGVVLACMLLDAVKYSYLIRISTGKFRIRNSIKVMFLGRYYDGITPLGTGGQPFQIYYLHKKDIPAGVATAVPLVKFIVNTFVYCAIAVVLFSFAPVFLPGSWGDRTLLVIAWISMICNLLVPVAILFASLFPRAGKKLIVKFVGLLNKVRIVKHKYPTMRKYVYEIDEYRHSLKAIFRRWWLFIPLFFICLAEILLSTALPFFCVLAVGNIEPNAELLLEMICLGMISFYSASLIPTPGNSGAFEGAAAIIFATVLATHPGVNAVLVWVILVWRFFSYYVYILSGIGITIFEIIRGAVRTRRATKRGSGPS